MANFNKDEMKDLSGGSIASTYAAREMIEPISAFHFPEKSMQARVAYQLCSDQLNLDGRPELNLATFVTTWMEPEVRKLIDENLNKNLVDQDEYPQAVKIEEHCVNMLADLLNANQNEGEQATGTSTVGSSEAIMLAGLALKKKWSDWQKARGGSTAKPNLIMGANVQVVWEKFARYFEVEPRYVKLSSKDERYIIDVEGVLELVDENTIGVAAILGSTFTGEFEPIEALNDALEKLNKKNDWQVPIHVDAASGGFVAPFIYPKLKWDFRLSLVQSINISGHKYGLVYPGVGWVLWRDHSALPEDLIFYVNYLGGNMPTFNLNFSRPSAFVIAQYYNFIRLGFEGYQKIMVNLSAISGYLTEKMAARQWFEIVSKPDALPLVAWRLSPDCPFTVFQLSERLRIAGWIVPAYTMPEGAEDVAVMRVVVREGLSEEMTNNLLTDIDVAVDFLTDSGGSQPQAPEHTHATKAC